MRLDRKGLLVFKTDMGIDLVADLDPDGELLTWDECLSYMDSEKIPKTIQQWYLGKLPETATPTEVLLSLLPKRMIPELVWHILPSSIRRLLEDSDDEDVIISIIDRYDDPAEAWNLYGDHPNANVRKHVCAMQDTEIAYRCYKDDPSPEVRKVLVGKQTPGGAFNRFSRDESPDVRTAVVKMQNLPSKIQYFSRDCDPRVREAVALMLPVLTRLGFAEDPSPLVRRAAERDQDAANSLIFFGDDSDLGVLLSVVRKQTPEVALEKFGNSESPRVLAEVVGKQTPEVAWTFLTHPREIVRLRALMVYVRLYPFPLGMLQDDSGTARVRLVEYLPPTEAYEKYGNDPDPQVREAVVNHLPLECAIRFMGQDPSPRVRNAVWSRHPEHIRLADKVR